TCLAVSKDGKRVLTGDQNNELKLWDLEKGKELRKLPGGHETPPRAAAVSPDGKFALTAAGGVKPGVAGLIDLHVLFWDLEKGTILYRFTDPKSLVRAVAFTADGKYAVAGGMDVPLRVWDLRTKKQVRTFPNAESNEGLVNLVPAGGSRILVGRGNG